MLKIKQKELLSKHTTLKIGGPAKYFCEPNDIDELLEALKFARRKKLQIFILGAGSNLLVSDKGFDGIVIKFKGAAGLLLSKLLNNLALNGLSGLEFLAGIPGTLGGAIYMNAGAYGQTIGDYIASVCAVDYKGKQFCFNSKECKSGYRKSIFQKKKLIITGVEFDLQKRKPADIKTEMKEIIKKRLAKQPYDMPSAGSFFKNPKGDYSARLIEAAGLKGLRVGDAMVSKKHANFIVNAGKATAVDVKRLMKQIQKKVYVSFKIKLTPEVVFLG